MPSSPIPKNTSVWLDALRGASAQAVLLGHLYQLFFYGSHEASEPSRASTWLHGAIIFLSQNSHNAVMVFFVLSGYLVGGKAILDIISRKFKWSIYFADRLTRLWVVLIPCLFLTYVIDKFSISIGNGIWIISEWRSMYPFDWLQGDPWSPIRFASNALFLDRALAPHYGTNLSLWSLTNEFWYYAALPAILLLMRGYRNCMIGAIILFSISILLKTFDPRITTAFLSGFCIWIAGSCLRTIANTRRLLIASALAFVGCIVIDVSMQPQQGSMAGDFYIGLLTLASIGLSGYVPMHRVQNVARFFAKYSYSLYAIHLPVLVAFMAIDPLTSLSRPYHGLDLIRFCGYALSANIVGYAFWFAFEGRTQIIRRHISELARSIMKMKQAD